MGRKIVISTQVMCMPRTLEAFDRWIKALGREESVPNEWVDIIKNHLPTDLLIHTREYDGSQINLRNNQTWTLERTQDRGPTQIQEVGIFPTSQCLENIRKMQEVNLIRGGQISPDPMRELNNARETEAINLGRDIEPIEVDHNAILIFTPQRKIERFSHRRKKKKIPQESNTITIKKKKSKKKRNKQSTAQQAATQKKKKKTKRKRPIKKDDSEDENIEHPQKRVKYEHSTAEEVDEEDEKLPEDDTIPGIEENYFFS